MFAQRSMQSFLRPRALNCLQAYKKPSLSPGFLARSMSGGVEWHGTTIVVIRKDGKVAMAGD